MAHAAAMRSGMDEIGASSAFVLRADILRPGRIVTNSGRVVTDKDRLVRFFAVVDLRLRRLSPGAVTSTGVSRINKWGKPSGVIRFASAITNP